MKHSMKFTKTGIRSAFLLTYCFIFFSETLWARAGGTGRKTTVFPAISVGSASILEDSQLSGPLYTGYMYGLGVGVNREIPWFSMELQFGWAGSAIQVEAGSDLQSSAQNLPTRVSTRYVEAGVAGRLRLTDEWEFGPGINFPFGTDTSFSPAEDKDSSAHVFWTLELLRKASKGSTAAQLRYGFQVMKDINIPGRNVLMLRVQLAYRFSFDKLHDRIYGKEDGAVDTVSGPSPAGS